MGGGSLLRADTPQSLPPLEAQAPRPVSQKPTPVSTPTPVADVPAKKPATSAPASGSGGIPGVKQKKVKMPAWASQEEVKEPVKQSSGGIPGVKQKKVKMPAWASQEEVNEADDDAAKKESERLARE